MYTIATIIIALIVGLLLAALPHIIWLIVWIISKIAGFHLVYAPFGWSALGLVLFGWVLIAYGGLIGRWRMQVTQLDFVHQEVPKGFDGYKIVHISDLHLASFDGHEKQLHKFVDQINSLEPDLVCFTGDLVTSSPKEALAFAQELSRIEATDGVTSVLGNHDLLIYVFRQEDMANREQMVDSLAAIEREQIGWRLLRNEHFDLTRGQDTITIIGVDNIHGAGQGFETISGGDLSKATEGMESHFSILLSHDPSHWMAEVVPQTRIPLTLSGHTHAAQLRFFGWSPAKLVFKQSEGRYDHGDQTLYVNTGLGCTAPIRIGVDPEFTVITLRSQKAS